MNSVAIKTDLATAKVDCPTELTPFGNAYKEIKKLDVE